ncbi:hypothetical protein HIM_09320 [Hirsutella minnesotensis 3608]|uniref:N-acetyltransferase domain-containing protein n=1 Tax=Hirsutella minnesotensis 3608 TaxID=1043627 RepID=A0A0F7ZLP2_9HYPO|nr:hypothetical protein HIM_09320 [Hirsutella minnesotensis 3608]
MKIRRATGADVPAVARLVLAALADEAPWKLILASKTDGNGTEAAIEYGERMLLSCLESKHHIVLVLEVSGPESRAHSNPLIVSACVWDTSAAEACRSAANGGSAVGGLHERGASGRLSHSPVADIAKIPDKLAALDQAGLVGRQRRFADRGPFLYLHILATRPDFQRRGYGKALVLWGMDLARQDCRPICAQAAPRGYVLLSGLGFIDLGPVSLPAEIGTGEGPCLKALMYDPASPRRRGSLVSLISRYLHRS